MPADKGKSNAGKGKGPGIASAWQLAAGSAKNGSKSATPNPTIAGAARQAPSAPAKPAWGSKSSDAVKIAAPIKPQQKPAPQRQQQSQQGRSGGEGQGRRGDNRTARRNDDQRGGGSNAGGSWARSVSKTAGSAGDRDGGAGNRRQSQSRGSGRPNRGDHSGENENWSRGRTVPVELLEPGEGKTNSEKAVKRVSVNELLDMRLDYLSAPSSWEGEDATKPPPAVLWDAPTRIAEIEELAKAPRIGGDVSRNEKKKGSGGRGGKPNSHDTAPALEDCKPLEVNDETRWKAKVMVGKDATTAESAEEVLQKATLILNKLSLTKFDKLSDEFINCGIGRDVECLTEAVGLIVKYAHEMQHFSSMYARLCLKLAKTPMEGIDEGGKKGKKFKKILLERCQLEFETDTATKIKAATEGIQDPELIEYHAGLVKKYYLGHMRFIGELYKGDLISIKIMLYCLPTLLKGENDEQTTEIDEEKVECFSKLMTVIGSSLEKQSQAMRSIGKADAAKNLAECWQFVEVLAGKRKGKGPKVSNRIKFMLQDLLEMRSKGWVTRRKEETAKTIAEIHKEVANEERVASRRSTIGSSASRIRQTASSGDVRELDKAQSKPQVDNDGFVSVARSKGFNRSASMTAMPTHSVESQKSSKSSGGRGGGRFPSESKFSVLNQSGSRRNSKKGRSKTAAPVVEDKKAEVKESNVNYPKPEECGNKVKNILKEYFVSGDMDDAVLSIHELVGAGFEGSVERGTKVVESAVLLVLEMKADEVNKFLTVYLRCAKEKKIDAESFRLGLSDPLEFLQDIVIDAPLAGKHLVHIVAGLIIADVISFSFLLNSPEDFRSNQNAAEFGAKVMKSIGNDGVTSERYIEVVEKLMTEEEKSKYKSASDLVAVA